MVKTFAVILTTVFAHDGHLHVEEKPDIFLKHHAHRINLGEVFGRNHNKPKNQNINMVNDTIAIIESLQGLPEEDILDELFNFSQTGFLRSITQLGDPYTSYNNYGCWCYFDSHNNAKGATVDTYDEFCRTLHLGYECLLVDHAVDNDDYSTKSIFSK